MHWLRTPFLVVGMVDAIAAYKEAFASYKKNTVEYAKYSFLLGVLGSLLGAALGVAFFIILMLFSGSAASIAVMLSDVSAGLFGIAAVLLVLGTGVLVFAWAEMGLTGAYLETINAILSGKKQSINGFFAAIPKRATTLTLVGIIEAAVISVPVFATIFLAIVVPSGGQFPIAQILIGLAGLAVAFVLFLFLAFAIPASIVDGRGAIDSVRRSLSLGVRNIIPLAVYYVVGLLLMLPALFPGIGQLYAILFAAPLMNGALLTMYRKAK